MTDVMNMLVEERAAIDVLEELCVIKENIATLKARESELVERVKQYMQLEDIEDLRDEERGITAHLQRREGTPMYDLAQAPEHAIVMAAKAMLLTLDHKSFQRMRGRNGATWMDELARFEMPGKGSEALIVRREKP